MNKIYSFIIFLIFGNQAFSQSFLNGSFECNTASTCDYNNGNAAFTAKVANTVAYGGGGELDIFQASCGYGTVQNGLWKVGIATPGGVSDAFTMMLNAPLVAGITYTISFWDLGDPTYPPGVPIQIGLSTTVGAAGTFVYTGPIPTSGVWNNRIFSFVAPNNGQYISVSSPGPTRWTHVDNFTFIGGSSVGSTTLTATPSGSICLGSSKTLTVTGGSTYTWSPSGSLSLATGSNVIASPSVTTTYTVLSSVISCSGTATSSAVVTVSVVSSPTLTISSSTAICLGGSSILTVSGGSTYTWNPSGSLSSASLSTVTATPTITTTYTVVGALGSCTNSAVTTISITPSPTLTINPSINICSGSSATLSVSGASSYTWSPGGSLSSISLSTVIATPTITTSYTVVGANGTCTNSAVTTVSVTSVTLTVNPSTSICLGGTATLSVNGATTYSWGPGGSLSSTSLSTITATPTITTTYSVIGSIGTCTNSAVTTVSVSNTLTLSITPSSTICSGGSTNLIVSGATVYSWSPSGSLSSASLATVVANPTVTTNYLVIGSIGSCSASITTTVIVGASPIINLIASPPIICSSKSSTITVLGGATYTWSPSLSLSTTSGSVTVSSPNISTTYSVASTSSVGCISTGTVYVNVVLTPTLVLTSSSATICEGTSSNLQAFGASNYLWSPSATLSSSTSSNVVATPIVTTLYTAIGNNGACTDSKNILITVIPKIIPGLTPRDTSICLGKTIQLIASGGNNYLWSPASSLSSATNPNVIAKPLVTTIYTVVVSVNNICPQTKSVKIIVNPLPFVYAGKDSIINNDENIKLIGSGDGVFGFKPMNGEALLCNYCTEITVSPKENTCYLLHSINSFGCENTDEVCITVTKDYNIYIPNSFSPNGDVDNEFFLPVGYGIEGYDMSIFDRWGNLIFKSNADHKAWDGSVKGKTVEQGVYVYKIIVKTMGGKDVTKIGHVTVLSKVK